MAGEFNCLPSQIEAERQTLPTGLLDDVIEARRYAEWKRLYDDDPKRALQSRMGQLVMEIHAEFVQEEAEAEANG